MKLCMGEWMMCEKWTKIMERGYTYGLFSEQRLLVWVGKKL